MLIKLLTGADYPSRGSSGGAPNLRAHPGLHPYGPPPGMALPYNPMMVVMMPPPPPPVPPAVQPPGAPPVRDLGSVPPELTAGHQSFHMAMANPNGKVSSCNMEDPGLIPGLGRSPGEGNDNPLQYSCLENPMDGGAW